ncbi:hypothetical protein [Nocardia salmonicida]|uniref:hypothetical protein n=1 Tax=Nocardia salmonicida TaxID=53431 RepID=UPI0034091C7A
MDSVPFSLVDGRIHIDAYSDAVKFVQLSTADTDVRDAAAMAHHIDDLQHAHQAVVRLSTFPEDPKVVREALWRSAIVTYWKVFDHASKRHKRKLRPEEVYEPGLPQEVFAHFKRLRHEVVAHNAPGPFLSNIVGAVIGPSEDLKVERVLQLHMAPVHIEESAVTNLGLLVENALNWAINELDRVHDEIADRLRRRPYQALVDLPSATIDKPRW